MRHFPSLNITLIPACGAQIAGHTPFVETRVFLTGALLSRTRACGSVSLSSKKMNSFIEFIWALQEDPARNTRFNSCLSDNNND
jgi:hypothetical protein